MGERDLHRTFKNSIKLKKKKFEDSGHAGVLFMYSTFLLHQEQDVFYNALFLTCARGPRNPKSPLPTDVPDSHRTSQRWSEKDLGPGGERKPGARDGFPRIGVLR